MKDTIDNELIKTLETMSKCCMYKKEHKRGCSDCVLYLPTVDRRRTEDDEGAIITSYCALLLGEYLPRDDEWKEMLQELQEME